MEGRRFYPFWSTIRHNLRLPGDKCSTYFIFKGGMSFGVVLLGSSENCHKMDYNTERENNIIKNIAKEIEAECLQNGFSVTHELTNYMVKLKLLNPKNGFTASQVMPRSLTQQLVTSVVEDLKQDTPAINCIKLQVYWNSLNLDTAEIKKQYVANLTEKAEIYLTEILELQSEYNSMKLSKQLACYILISEDLGNIVHHVDIKETVAAVHSVLKPRDVSAFIALPEENKIEQIKELAKRVTGIRLYLKYSGRAGEAIQDVKKITEDIDVVKNGINLMAAKVYNKIETIRDVFTSVLVMDYFTAETAQHADILLPPECDMNDLKYLKKILVIMLQHGLYLNDLMSKLEEIDGNVNFYLREYDSTLERLQETIKDREAVPTTEVYDDFKKAGELWVEIKSYFHCLHIIEEVMNYLDEYNKEEYFEESALERYTTILPKTKLDLKRRSTLENKSIGTSSNLGVDENAQEDFHVEFNGFCAWTLYFAEGFLIQGNPSAGYFQHEDMYFTFSNKDNHDLWSRDPQYYLMEIYEMLRVNPEMVELLNAYDNLYAVKSLQIVKKADRKVSSRSDAIQTETHPVEKFWDKDYTFSIWELKKRALTLSRLVKCVTKSVQTTSPHSHYRASIGLLAAPDKSKETQTKRDNSCMHETISNYLYGLRGHRENKFKVIDLTRPVDETYERQIILEEGDPCVNRRQKETKEKPLAEPCYTWSPPDFMCHVYSDSDYSFEYMGEGY